MDQDNSTAISLDPSYQQLKQLDELLDLDRQSVDQAKSAYQETLQHFATLCHEFWQQEKAQGSRQGKGFRQSLQSAGINVNRAYRAMRKFFPADFPVQSKKLKNKKISTSIATIEVSSAAGPMSELDQRLAPCSQGAGLQADVSEANQIDPSVVRSTGELTEGHEVLECKFALTPEDKTEFFEALKFVDRSQVWPLLLDAVKQAARQVQSVSGSPARASFDCARDGLEALMGSSHDEAEAGNPQTLSDNNQSSTPSEDNDYSEFLDQYNEITDPLADSAAEGLERLERLHDSLQLREPHDDLPGLAAMFTPEELHAKLDWMDSCPGWRIGVYGATELEFDRIFQLVPTDGSPPPQ